MSDSITDHPGCGAYVFGTCFSCQREPRGEEMYGSGALDWDPATNICPECWDRMFPDEDE